MRDESYKRLKTRKDLVDEKNAVMMAQTERKKHRKMELIKSEPLATDDDKDCVNMLSPPCKSITED